MMMDKDLSITESLAKYSKALKKHLSRSAPVQNEPQSWTLILECLVHSTSTVQILNFTKEFGKMEK